MLRDAGVAEVDPVDDFSHGELLTRIKAFWTSRAEVPGEVGETLKVEFAIAPLSFDLRLEQSDERTVVWRTEMFPPHWVGTTVRWDVEARDAGSTVSFRHAGFADEDRQAGSPTPGVRSWCD